MRQVHSAVAIAVGEESLEALAMPLPRLEVALGANSWALLILVSPVDEVAITLMLLPAPLAFTKERSLMEALLDFAEDINETSRNRDFLVWRHKINSDYLPLN
jgi:hypothetical protein